MVAAVEIRATAELEAVQPTIEASLQRFRDQLNALPPDDLAAVIEGATRALSTAGEPVPAVITVLSGGRHVPPAERVEAELDVLTRSFARRRALLDGALTTSQVAGLLGTSRQTPHDRVASGTLLAVLDRGALRFPPWQFDPDGEDGVVRGLPAVIRSLDVSPMGKVSWLTRTNAMLDGLTPLACLNAGQVERVVALARAVGAG
jgi:hypothetical protein